MICPHCGKTIKKKSEHDEGEFLVFWEKYPRKVGKGAARTAFYRCKASLETLLRSIEDHKQTEQWKKNDGAFVPFPSTFLNQERWEDELETAYVPVNHDIEKRSQNLFK